MRGFKPFSFRSACSVSVTTIGKWLETWKAMGFLVVALTLCGLVPSFPQQVHALGTCKAGEFRCQSNGHCVPKSKVCDGIRDCDDGMDENSMICASSKLRRGLCGYRAMDYKYEIRRLGGDGYSALAQAVVSHLLGGGPKKFGVFQCQYSGCVPISRVCDGSINCLDGSDESEHICGANSCLPGQFRCKYGACIPDWRMCNGIANCPDGSDETAEACRHVRCKENEFKCKYGACIPLNRICDARKHCIDGSDESAELCLITRAKLALKWDSEDKLAEERSRVSQKLASEEEKRRARLMGNYTRIPTSNSFNGGQTKPVVTNSIFPSYNDRTSPVTYWTTMKLPKTTKMYSVTIPALAVTYSPPTTTKVSVRASSSTTAKPKIPSSSSLTTLTTKTPKPKVTVTTAVTTKRPPPIMSHTRTESFEKDKFKTAETAVVDECVLPEIPHNSEATITTCRSNPDASYCAGNATRVPIGVLIQYECNPGFILDGAMYIACHKGGNWSTPPPNCDPFIDVRVGLASLIPRDFKSRCQALNPTRGIRVECINPKNLEVTSCYERQNPGVEARFSCAPYYRPSGDLPVHYEKCDEEGNWNPGVHAQFTCVPECGVSEAPKTPYITNGHATKRGQWPWHVGIYVMVKKELKYICGGALITEQSVLTSAHCVTSNGQLRAASEFVLFLGKEHIGLPDTDPFVQRRLVTKVFVEDSFNPLALDSDIAILALDSAAVLTFYVRPVCYPQTSNSFLEEYQLATGNKGTVLGWGLTESGNLSKELKMTELPVVSAMECADSHRDFFASMTRSTTYCAGYRNGTSVCNGDSGGGMYFRAVTRGQSRWYVQGLVSYGVPQEGTKTCASNHYAVFTRVGRYGDWIVRTLSRENLI